MDILTENYGYLSLARSLDRAKDNGTLAEEVAMSIGYGYTKDELLSATEACIRVSQEDINNALADAKEMDLLPEEREETEEPVFYESVNSEYHSNEPNFLTMEDIIEGINGNMSEEGIDNELKLYSRYAKELGIKDYMSMVVFVDETGEVDPSYVLPDDGVPVEVKGERTVTKYFDTGMLAERFNGNLFLFFKDEESMDNYLSMAREFVRNIDLDEEVCYSGDCEDEEATSIQEALNILDKRTNNQFDLLNLFLSEEMSRERSDKLIEMLKGNTDIKEIHKYLREDRNEYVEDEMDPEDYIKKSLESGKISDSMTIFDMQMVDRAKKALTDAGIPFDSYETYDGTCIEWTVMSSENDDTKTNLSIANTIIAKANEIKDYAEAIAKHRGEVQAVSHTAEFIEKTIEELRVIANGFIY